MVSVLDMLETLKKGEEKNLLDTYRPSHHAKIFYMHIFAGVFLIYSVYLPVFSLGKNALSPEKLVVFG